MSVGKSMVHYFKKRPFIFIFTIFIIVAITIISILPPQILKIIIDDSIHGGSGNKLLGLAILYVSIHVGIGLIDFMKQVVLVVISQGITKEIKLAMFKKITKIDYLNFSRYSSGELEAYFSNDVDSINALITSGVISMIIDLFKIVGIIISIFIFSTIFGFISLGLIPFMVFFTMWVRKRMFQAQVKNRELEGKVNSQVLESLDNINTIKSYRIYHSITSKYNKVLKKHYQTNQSANFYDAMFSPVMQFTRALVVSVIIVLSTSNMSLFGMTIGMLVSSIDYLTDLFAPIENLGTELQTIQKSLAGINRINSFFKINEDESKMADIYLNFNEIILKFDHVYFGYTDTLVLEDFNLELSNCSKLTLQGKSGSGKSTIFKLAYGLIKPTKGRVTINGVDTYLMNDEIKRKLFGVVYQDYFFSDKTIKEEVTLRNPCISDKRVYEVLKMVGLERINDIHMKLNINDYSTGELSLFNIARAIVNDSKLLFLDEMNAKIDPVSAKTIMDVINTIGRNKMILSINHYGSLLDNSDVLNLNSF